LSIKAGAILHDANGYVVDRIQSAGPGSLNIPEEKIYELGNWQTIATVRDIPDLSFDLESFDVSCEFEAILLGLDPTGLSAGQALDLQEHIPIDVISPFKSRRNAFDIVKGLAVPYLTLERATYRYGLRQNAAQQFTLRGDSIYYIPGQPYYEEFAYTADASLATGTAFQLDNNDPILYSEGNDDVYALCVVLVNTDTREFRRLYHDTTGASGYTDTNTGEVYVNENLYSAVNPCPTGKYNLVRVVYGSETLTDYDPGVNNVGTNPSGNTIHQNVSTKPAAVRPKDIDVYIGAPGATAGPFTRMNSVQSAEVNWSVQLENDEEFGNKHYVAQDYDVPDVTGTIGVKPFDPADLWNKLAQITGVDPAEVIGPELTTPVPIAIVINHPDTGDTMKTIFVPDARFQVPGLQGRIQTKLETSFTFTSDQGLMTVYNGAMPGM
jgi:hypothetical protein